ncbi:hypothetical protein OPQ81_000071 [Rhizoctonia solani]|nr:hypothetical protein OPQ81_000071 [Rhizoctonia solani]
MASAGPLTCDKVGSGSGDRAVQAAVVSHSQPGHLFHAQPQPQTETQSLETDTAKTADPTIITTIGEGQDVPHDDHQPTILSPGGTGCSSQGPPPAASAPSASPIPSSLPNAGASSTSITTTITATTDTDAATTTAITAAAAAAAATTAALSETTPAPTLPPTTQHLLIPAPVTKSDNLRQDAHAPTSADSLRSSPPTPTTTSPDQKSHSRSRASTYETASASAPVTPNIAGRKRPASSQIDGSKTTEATTTTTATTTTASAPGTAAAAAANDDYDSSAPPPLNRRPTPSRRPASTRPSPVREHAAEIPRGTRAALSHLSLLESKGGRAHAGILDRGVDPRPSRARIAHQGPSRDKPYR